MADLDSRIQIPEFLVKLIFLTSKLQNIPQALKWEHIFCFGGNIAFLDPNPDWIRNWTAKYGIYVDYEPLNFNLNDKLFKSPYCSGRDVKGKKKVACCSAFFYVRLDSFSKKMKKLF
jgi:hypothetical protein